MRKQLVLTASLVLSAALATAFPADSARTVRRFRLGALLGTNLQRFGGGIPASVIQRIRPGLDVGVVGRWTAKNGVIGVRLEATLTHASHRWQEEGPGVDLRYRSRYIGVAPLLDVALLRARRLHLLAGVQLNTWLKSARVLGKEPTRAMYYYDGVDLMPVYSTPDRPFHPGSGNPFRLLLGATWAVRPRVELGLRVERGERYMVRSWQHPTYNPRTGPYTMVRLQAVRASVVWWLR